MKFMLISYIGFKYMGTVISPEQKIQANVQMESDGNKFEESRVENDYDMEVIQVSNIALAIRNKEHTINVELSLRCESLPATKAFGSTDSMIVILKSDDSGDSSSKNFMEIGRTQVIFNELNPKYIKTFIFPFKGEKNEELQFRLYHIQNPNSDSLRQQKLIGYTNASLYNLVESEKDDLEIKLVSKGKGNAKLKYNCTEYEGVSSQYEVGIELTNFSSRSEVYYIIEAWKYGEWIPVARSESRKASKFKEIKVPVNKFQGEDNSGVKIKVYEAEKEEEIGCTKQFSILDIFSDEKTQSHRVYQNGFIMGTLIIYKWKKIIRDSFISYIVGGARLHLLLALDFTNSNNSQGKSLHSLNQKGENDYTTAIRQIVGVLQYFSLQNRVALYGFGAKLPPYYKSVSQCFALNGNYFNPNIEGGVEEIIALYKQNLKKVKMHGPTKLSEILQLAIKYASDEENMSMKSSSTYYVLLILTDGKINDYEDTVDLIVKASSLPLSVLFVGVGDGDEEGNFFEALHSLDSDNGQLKSSRNDKICERDIVDFIKISDYVNDPNKQTLARETFAEIPNQFIDYMVSRNIKPSKEKKNLKAAKAEFIAQKIKLTQEKVEPFLSSFLEKEHKEMRKKLITLGFNSSDPLLQKMQISTNDLIYFIEVHSQNNKKEVKEPKVWVETINIREVNKLEQFLEKKDKENKNKTLVKLQKIQSNHYGRRPRQSIKKVQIPPEQVEPPQHPCIQCRVNEIDLIHMECGHVSLCFKCFSKRCPICWHTNKEVKRFYYDETGQLKGYEQDSDSD